MISIIYSLLAIFGLGVLVFIHELGHYFVARRKGMRVEAFAIGFGKPLFTWERDGVKWRICLLPFGGYVKIAGMQKENGKEPSEITDGFFGKSPWARIQVAFAGPLVNIVFAFVVFAALWAMGGRTKPFVEMTTHIGWIDPHSQLYKNGVRPGDQILQYDGRAYHGFKDLLVASIMKQEYTQISGEKIDYLTGEKTPFDYTLATYQNPLFKDKIGTVGVLSPAQYLIYPGTELPPRYPASLSGVEKGDRLLWANGDVLFSMQQLSTLTNEPSAFLTVERQGEVLQVKAPRARLSDLSLTAYEKDELGDWQHEAGLKGRLSDLYYIPFTISSSMVVEEPVEFIEESAFPFATSLQPGDKILAVYGERIVTPYEFLQKLQQKKLLVIVQRDPVLVNKTTATEADAELVEIPGASLQKLIDSIGTENFESAGNLYLLKPIEIKSIARLPLPTEQRQAIAQAKERIEQIPDLQKRKELIAAFEKEQQKEVIGLPLIDRQVTYNPTPLAQFKDVLNDTYRTLKSLFSGSASPKYVAGPVGIVHIVQQSWSTGPAEALFWMALISLNLGIMNLLPLPVLDGGHIFFALVEMVIRRPIKAKTMERMIIPFVVLLIGFFAFVTFNDISRLIGRFL